MLKLTIAWKIIRLRWKLYHNIMLFEALRVIMCVLLMKLGANLAAVTRQVT